MKQLLCILYWHTQCQSKFNNTNENSFDAMAANCLLDFMYVACQFRKGTRNPEQHDDDFNTSVWKIVFKFESEKHAYSTERETT